MNNKKTYDLIDSLPAPWDRMFALAIRIGVWGLFFAVLYWLRSFFLLIFLTFVFSYLQSHAVHLLEGRIKNRTARVVVVGGILLCILVAIGFLVVPMVREQALVVAEKFPSYVRTLDKEVLILAEDYPYLQNFVVQPTEEVSPTSNSANNNEWQNSPSVLLFQQLLSFGDGKAGGDNVLHLLKVLREIGAKLLAAGSAFFLSLLFSFLIVLDLPKLTANVSSLSKSKIGFVYDEVSDSIRGFGSVLGQALEAQIIIALANTVFTAILIYFLGLGSRLALLSVVVFLCSFIPVAGVFISSVPICLMTFAQSGISGLLIAIIAIWVIHLIEAYMLNPKIYGHHLQINPVLVLIVLTIGGKLFHVWGLILGVPVCTYFFGHAIQYRQKIYQPERKD